MKAHLYVVLVPYEPYEPSLFWLCTTLDGCVCEVRTPDAAHPE